MNTFLCFNVFVIQSISSDLFRLILGERAPGTHWIGGRMNPTASLDDVKRTFLNFPGFELRPLGQSLYQLSYPDQL
jgi:hypothetical protein